MHAQAQQAGTYYLGVDGGGSKTLAVVVDTQGHEVARGEAAGSNHNNVGMEVAMRNLRLAIENASVAAAYPLPFGKAWLGISGLDRPDDHQTLLPLLQDVAQQVHLTNDGELGLSALDNAAGVAIIAGTGSIILGRDSQGRTARTGGWGYLIGDEGSGYFIAHNALIAAARSSDGRGPQTLLLDLILEHWHISKPEDLIGQVYVGDSKAKVAQLARCVFQAARQGDAIAQQIVTLGAEELALAVHAVCQQLDFPQHNVPLALVGSLLVHETTYRASFLASVRQHGYEPGQVAIVETPALSAAQAAITL
ncbi:MAG TPA: BadF/BadG/BcrA/BcrD ATPase family protein [Ktedonobacteraceae bacterium]|jgi:N-acetylglucosamine kinase-like BadF-type ATPase|nr:BadF/BadG/BcrA/BcrD ATPase family protein [Ktedonobacteraceae bacterium]